MGSFENKKRRFGIKAQLLTLLLLFFLLLVFFTATTLRQQQKAQNAFKDQQKLLSFTVQLNNIAYLLYQDKLLLRSASDDQGTSLAGVNEALSFNQSKQRQLFELTGFETFNDAEVTTLENMAHEFNQAPKKLPNPSDIHNLQKSVVRTHNRLIERLLDTQPHPELIKAKNIAKKSSKR